MLSRQRADYLKKLLLDELTNLKNKGVTDDEVQKTKENFIKSYPENLKNNSFIMDRVKNYINNGVYTPLPENSTDIYNKLDGRKIQTLAQKIFNNDYVEAVLKPTVKTN